MSLQIVHCSDLHLDSTFDSMNMDDVALQNRKRDLDDNFTRIVEYVRKNKPDVFLISGDIFDHPTPSNESLVFFTRKVRELHEAGINVFLIGGDHDIPKFASNTGSTIDIFKSTSIGTVFGSTRSLHKKRLLVNGKSLCISGKSSFSTYTTNHHDQPLSNVALDGDYNILMLHGRLLFNDSEAATGAVSPDNHELFSAAELPQGLNYVALGENHSHFERDHDGIRICNAGSPERMAWSEIDEPKGFVWVELNGSETRTEFIKLPTRKMKRDALDVSLLNGSKEIEDRIGVYLSEHYDRQMIFRLDIGGKIPLDQHSNLKLGEIYAKYRKRFFHLQLDTDELTKSVGNELTHIDPTTAFTKRIDDMAAMPSLTEEEKLSLRNLKDRGIKYLKEVRQY